MGGSGTTGTTNQGPPVVPGYLDPYLNSYLGDFAAATSELPSLSSLYQNFPLQGTAPLTGQQNTDINAFQTGSPILTPQQQTASRTLTILVIPRPPSRPLSSSPPQKLCNKRPFPARRMAGQFRIV